MKNIKIRLAQAIVIMAILLCGVSCSGYQNPGNNSGKTGDGTGVDSLKAKKNDTGKGANLRDKAINRANDSVKSR